MLVQVNTCKAILGQVMHGYVNLSHVITCYASLARLGQLNTV